MTNTILVPVDISHTEHFDAMMASARKISDPDDTILVLNVVEDVPAFVSSQLPAHLTEDNKKHAAEKLNALASKAGGNIMTKVVSGHAASAILDAAEDSKASVIVIGSHKPGWQDYLIGSTAARVVRHAKCAVYVLR